MKLRMDAVMAAAILCGCNRNKHAAETRPALIRLIQDAEGITFRFASRQVSLRRLGRELLRQSVRSSLPETAQAHWRRSAGSDQDRRRSKVAGLTRRGVPPRVRARSDSEIDTGA